MHGFAIPAPMTLLEMGPVRLQRSADIVTDEAHLFDATKKVVGITLFAGNFVSHGRL